MNSSIFRSFSLNTTKTIKHQNIDIDETPISVLNGEKLSINKILSRDSSLGKSSRIYYKNTTNVGVPFQWEKKPGTPKNPPQDEVILQLTPPPPPPPAVQSLVLPRPNVDTNDYSLTWRFWLWRSRLRKNMRIRVYDSKSLASSSICLSNEQFESFRQGVPFCCTTWRRYKRKKQ